MSDKQEDKPSEGQEEQQSDATDVQKGLDHEREQQEGGLSNIVENGDRNGLELEGVPVHDTIKPSISVRLLARVEYNRG